MNESNYQYDLRLIAATNSPTWTLTRLTYWVIFAPSAPRNDVVHAMRTAAIAEQTTRNVCSPGLAVQVACSTRQKLISWTANSPTQ